MKNRIFSIIFISSLLAVSTAVAKDNLNDLTAYMKYLTERDTVLAQNIANADTPGFKPKDLSDYSRNPIQGMKLTTTNSKHLSLEGESEFHIRDSEILELKPNGNAVTIEHELQKKSENAVKLQEIANIYGKSKGMLKTAITGHN
ncbi:hypothetical protein H1Q59_08165 [Holosporaceae bacterium 'Namur']|nr:hypothetical protein [Holosporaceae bacterium 'Namur']